MKTWPPASLASLSKPPSSRPILARRPSRPFSRSARKRWPARRAPRSPRPTLPRPATPWRARRQTVPHAVTTGSVAAPSAGRPRIPSAASARRRVGLGKACTSDCESSLACVNGTCVAPVMAGGALDATHPCQATLSCRSAVCSTPLGAGEACNTTTDCDLEKGYFCASTKTCQAFGLAKTGERPVGWWEGVVLFSV